MTAGPQPERQRAPYWWPAALAAGLGLMLTLTAFSYVRSVSHDRLVEHFERASDNQAQACRQRLEQRLEVLFHLADYFALEGEVSRAQFRAMARGALARLPGVRALEWVPVVPEAARAEFEARARRDGAPGFRLTERDAQGRLVPAPARAVHHPILYVEPLAGNERALGYAPELPPRDAAIARARDTGEAAATARFEPVQPAVGRYAVAFFVPVYRGGRPPAGIEARRREIRGFVEGVVVIGEMLARPLEAAEKAGMTLTLLDTSASAGEQVLLAVGPAQAADPEAPPAMGELRNDVPIIAAGRRWLLSYRLVDSRALETFGGLEWLVLAGGLLSSGLLGATLTGVLARRRHAEQLVVERTRALEQARALDQLKEEFAHAISHDLRAPLTAIQGYAELLEDDPGGELTPPQREYVQQINRGVRRLEGLVDDLLDRARFEAGKLRLRREPADLGATLRAASEGLRPLVEAAGLRLTLEFADEPLTGSLDAARIERVVVNLLHNAIKFTPPGGAIRLRAWREGGELRCEVEDTGPGVAPEQAAELFQRFSQLASGAEKGGAGLGLSIGRAIVEAHGGRIGLRDAPGQGAIFWFSLPAA